MKLHLYLFLYCINVFLKIIGSVTTYNIYYDNILVESIKNSINNL